MTAPRTFKLTLAYDGTDFAGWQVQPGERTVQGELEGALQQITSAPVRVTGSGRTDAGVHAIGQVASFQAQTRLATHELARALDAVLPADAAVVELADAPDGFHARRDAVSKRYRYVLYDAAARDVFARRTTWRLTTPLDVPAMDRAARALVGKHDFSSFESSGAPRESSVRTISDLTICREPQPRQGFITLEVEADGFLYNMVRAIVGTLVEVGRGAQGEDYPAHALAACDRSAAGPTAPPQGLFLVAVRYDK